MNDLEQTYKASADAALLAFQQDEISFAQWNRIQSAAAEAYFSAMATGPAH